MRGVYRALAYLIAVDVAIQAAVMVFAIAGMYRYITDGGVVDQAAMEAGEMFPEEVGFMLHGVNGMMVIPALAVLLLLVSFFAKVRRGVPLAAAVLALVVLQFLLGLGGHSTSLLGALHGLNAFLLVGAALAAAGAARPTTAAARDEASRPVARATS